MCLFGLRCGVMLFGIGFYRQMKLKRIDIIHRASTVVMSEKVRFTSDTTTSTTLKNTGCNPTSWKRRFVQHPIDKIKQKGIE